MSDNSDDDLKGSDTPGQKGAPGQPTDAELAEMTQEQLAAETDKTGEGEAEYPDGAQFFGE